MAAAWMCRPLALTSAILATMVGVPIILLAMYAVVTLGFNNFTVVSVLVTTMLLGATGSAGVWIAHLWVDLAENVSRKTQRE